MEWFIPGTVLKADKASNIEQQFSAMFLGGGIVLSQVTGITGLEAYTVQNWVKRGFLSPPERKHYSLRQLCRIININMLRGTLPLDHICSLLGYVNGQLNDERDDIIDDAELYFMFIKLASTLRDQYEPQQRQMYLEQTLEHYQEPYPGAADRVRKALQIMLTAWLAARMRQEAERMLQEIL